jgi:TIR domain-containing protein
MQPSRTCPPASIFISFRGDDEPYGAVLLQTALASRFGWSAVFRSSDSIRLGEDYVTELIGAVERCAVLLAVIGPRWSVGPGGCPRGNTGPDDWVQREIGLAFRAGKRVVPVLLGGARLPDRLDLHPTIAQLGQCQYRRLDYRRFHSEVAAFGTDLARLVPGLRRVPRPAVITRNRRQATGYPRRGRDLVS